MAAPRFVAFLAGRLKMVAAIATSAGAGDADKIPATGAAGTLDPTLLNAATTGNAKVVMTTASGTLDPSIMPVGIGADTASIVASETLAAGDLVNVWDNAGVANVRKADATAEGKEAVGFVLAGFSAAATALVYFEGRVSGLTGKIAGTRYYLSASTPGASTATPPSTTGNVVQHIGDGVSTSTLNFEPEEPVTVA